MASVEVLSATIAHVEEAKHEPLTKSEETKKDDVASPPLEPEQDDPEAEHDADMAPAEPETLAIALEAKVELADEPHKKVVGDSSAKVAPEPVEDKIEENAEVAPEPEQVVQDHEDEEEKQAGEEEKVSPQVKVEKKEN